MQQIIKIPYVQALAESDGFLCTCREINYRYWKGHRLFEYDSTILFDTRLFRVLVWYIINENLHVFGL